MTTDDFDDLPRGNGEKPTKEQAIAVYHSLRRRNRAHGTSDVLKTLIDLGFSTARSSVGRMLQGVEGREPLPHVNPAETRRRRARTNNRHQHKREKEGNEGKPTATVAGAADAIDPEKLGAVTARLVELLKKNGAEPALSSTELAITENRTRMALNIVIAEAMAQRPEILLLDMRGTAALVDALTVACKLSGGSAIDVSMPSAVHGATNGSGAYPMKEINPPPQVTDFSAKLAAFRRERAAADRVQQGT